MGEAKEKYKKQDEMKRFRKTLPLRIIKAITAIFLFPFFIILILPFFYSYHCYKNNIWFWRGIQL